ncbi:MAG: PilZ domain-containing protein [Parasphingorhabdus sp.]
MPRAVGQHTPDPRRATRFPVDFATICESRKSGEFNVKMTNVSAHGCQLVHEIEINKGDRIVVRLPIAGRIEAFLIWSHNGRSGFEFERVIRPDEFMEMIDKIGHSIG